MRYFVINTKNYIEATGVKLESLASVVDSFSMQSNRSGVRILLAVPSFYVGSLARRFSKLGILAQHLDDSAVGSTTGFLVPEVAKSSGAVGSLVNHSEHRINPALVKSMIQRLRMLDMTSIVCARNPQEVGKFTRFNPDFIAVEPPELIGSGRAVSKSRPKAISDSKDALDRNKSRGSKTSLLCGAGIVELIDAKRAVELGAEGILVASGVVKAARFRPKIAELVAGLKAAK